jgi:ribosomal protein S18 acetylase RimI-like enzyme
MDDLTIRPAEPSDYQSVISTLDDWWGGRHMSDMLPKLFFVHFHQTSFVAEQDGKIIGFLIGFLSQTFPDQAYTHFIGIHPDHRRGGLARDLYRNFFAAVRKHGCRTVHCVTSPVNKASIAFHLRMGFSIKPGNKVIEDILVTENYDGRGGDRVLFVKSLEA